SSRRRHTRFSRDWSSDVCSSDLYRDLFEHLPYPSLVTNPAGVIQEANEAAAGLLQCRRAALVGQPLAAFVAERGRSALRTRLRRSEERRVGQESAVRWLEGGSGA